MPGNVNDRIVVISEKDTETGELIELEKLTLSPCFMDEDEKREAITLERWLTDNDYLLCVVGNALRNHYSCALPINQPKGDKSCTAG